MRSAIAAEAIRAFFIRVYCSAGSSGAMASGWLKVALFILGVTGWLVRRSSRSVSCRGSGEPHYFHALAERIIYWEVRVE
jgi:hypothetical protein